MRRLRLVACGVAEDDSADGSGDTDAAHGRGGTRIREALYRRSRSNGGLHPIPAEADLPARLFDGRKGYSEELDAESDGSLTAVATEE